MELLRIGQCKGTRLAARERLHLCVSDHDRGGRKPGRRDRARQNRPRSRKLAPSLAPVDLATGPVKIAMQVATLFLREPATVTPFSVVTLSAPCVATAAAALIPVPVGLLRLGLQECAGAPPVAGIGRRRQQQHTHRSNQEQQFHIGTRRSTPRLGIVSLFIDVSVRGAQIPIEVPPLAAAQTAIREIGTLLALDHALLGAQAPCLASCQLTGTHSLHDTTVLLGLQPVDTRQSPGFGGMTPLVAKTGMPAMAAEPALRSPAPESAIAAVSPERMPLAAVTEALIGALISLISEAALAIMTLLMDVARHPVEIAVQMPPLAGAQVSIRPEGSLFTADGAYLPLEAACLATRQVALPRASLDAVLLRVLACIDAALALGGNGRNGDRAREQRCQECAHYHAFHVFLHFRLMPVAG